MGVLSGNGWIINKYVFGLPHLVGPVGEVAAVSHRAGLLFLFVKRTLTFQYLHIAVLNLVFRMLFALNI